MPAGRPRKFKSAEELEAAISAYFEECDQRKTEVLTKKGELVEVSDPRPYTLSGLAFFLDCHL